MNPTVRRCLLVISLLPGWAWATTLVKLEVPELSRASDAVVRARVEKVSSRWSSDGRRILTDVRLRVLERVSGECEDAPVVVQPGGVVGDIGQRVDGLAAFAEGEEAVLFLERRGPVHAVVGMAQGKWTVEQGPGGKRMARPAQVHARVVDARTQAEVAPASEPLPVDELLSKVRAARGGGK